MAEIFSLDARSAKFGDVPANGGMSAALAEIGYINENTLKVTQDAATKNEIRALGKGAVRVNFVEGVQNVEFDLLTHDLEVLADMLGGKVAGVAPNQKWLKSKNKSVFKSLEVIDGEGGKWEFPNVQLMGALIGNFSTTEPNLIKFTGTVLEPALTDGTVASTMYTAPNQVAAGG